MYTTISSQSSSVAPTRTSSASSGTSRCNRGQLFLNTAHHRQLRNATAQLAADLVRPCPGLVDQEVRVVRHAGPLPDGPGKQLRELAAVTPAAPTLIQHQRHDGAQLLLLRGPSAIPFPDSDAVLQQRDDETCERDEADYRRRDP